MWSTEALDPQNDLFMCCVVLSKQKPIEAWQILLIPLKNWFQSASRSHARLCDQFSSGWNWNQVLSSRCHVVWSIWKLDCWNSRHIFNASTIYSPSKKINNKTVCEFSTIFTVVCNNHHQVHRTSLLCSSFNHFVSALISWWFNFVHKKNHKNVNQKNIYKH